jgi:preprotein translocase subunit SecY
MMGVGPYITSSIIFQLLTQIIPSLEALQKEGEYGQRKIAQYTRMATIPLGILQAFGTLTFLKNAGVISQWTPWDLIFMILIALAGTLLLMWIGELMSEQGLGNGISLIVMMGIVSSFPGQLGNMFEMYRQAAAPELMRLGGFILLAAAALAIIIFMNEGQRNVPVTYARRTQGSRAYGGVDTHLPIKVNATGVIPIIFAVSMVLFPSVIAKLLEQAQSPKIQAIGTAITNFFNNQWYYAGIYFVLVIAFTYFYTSIVFQPKQMAENLQKNGGYIPGIRPGIDTEQYLGTVISRLTLVGALFLALIAVLPIVTQKATGVTTVSVGVPAS